MRFVLAILLILLSVSVGEPQRWAPFQAGTAPITPSGWGGGPFLRQRDVYGANPIAVNPYQYYVPGACNGPCTTSDYWQSAGVLGTRPYDLTKAACTSGTGNLAAATGRYLWVTTPDHESVNISFVDSNDYYIGYSNDPGVLPTLMVPRARYLSTVNSPGASFTGTTSGLLLTASGVTGKIALGAPVTWSGGSATVAVTNAGTGLGGAGTYTLSAVSGNAGPIAMATTFPFAQSNYFPSFVCDPDDSTYPYKIYMQFGSQSGGGPLGQYQTGFFGSSNLVDWVAWGVVTQPYTVGEIARAFNVSRDGVNTWTAIGTTADPTSFVLGPSGIWTSTNGYLFTYTGLQGNVCLPVNSPAGSGGCPLGNANEYRLPAGGLPDGLTVTVAGQKYLLVTDNLIAALGLGGGNNGGTKIQLAPIDGNFNILTSPPTIDLSDTYSPAAGCNATFPGPQCGGITGGYVESGILHYYTVDGFSVCLTAAACLANQTTYMLAGPFTASSTVASGSTVHLNSTAGLYNNMYVFDWTNPNAIFGDISKYISSISGNDIILNAPIFSTVTAGDVFYFWNGGLSHELVDRYCYVTDASAAANASPTGFTATASAGVVTLNWDQCLAGVNYRLYYGFSPTSQPNLIGSVTGDPRTTTYTPYLQTPQTMYFKLVTMNGSTEEGSRVTSTYVSPSTALTNAHMTRILSLQADPATIDRAWLDSAVNFMTANGLTGTCRYWGDPSFGVKQDTSGNTSVMFDVCSTLRPAFGDWAFCTVSGGNCSGSSTAVYNPTAFGSTTPGIAHPSTNGFSYAGGTSGPRINNLRRMTEITVCSSYSKPGSATATLVNYGGPDFQPPQMNLQHTSGSPGNASFNLWDDVTGATVTKAMSSNTGWHMICGTFSTAGSTVPTSKGTLEVYADGVASGSPDTTTLHTNVETAGALTLSLKTTLMGAIASGGVYLGMGSSQAKANITTGTAGPLTPPSYVLSNQEGNFTEGATVIFDKALTSTQILALYNLYHDRVVPPVAAGSPSVTITSAPYSATCNGDGTTDDSAAFTAWNTAAKAWDAANPSVPGSIVLTIPNNKCQFLQGGSSLPIVSGIVNHPVRVVGAGTNSELTDVVTGGGFILGSGSIGANWTGGENNSGTEQAFTTSTSRGATSVALTACPGAGCAAAVALFSVNSPARMQGLDMQGQGSGASPTNPAFWDYVTVTCTSTTLTCNGGNIGFTPPLTHDYKSTWPSYGFTFGSGAATLYVMSPSWPITVEYNNLKLDMTNGQGFAVNGKSITFKNVTFNPGRSVLNSCHDPSQDQLVQYINVDASTCNFEIDKIVDTIVYNKVLVHNTDYQSASVKQTLASEVTITTNWNGGGIHTTIANSTLPNWAPGAAGFGCSYGLLAMIGNNIGVVTTQVAGTSGGVNTVGTWSGGVYTVLNTDIASIRGGYQTLGFAIPGANVVFSGTDASQGPVLQVADVTQSGSSTAVTFLQNGTTYSGGLPTQPGATINGGCHYAPQLFAVGNYGNAWALDMNQVPPGAPMDSYSKIIVAGTNGTWTSATVPPTPPTVTGNPSTPYTDHVWGKMVSVAATVTAAYGGATTPFSFAMGSPFFDILGSTSRPQWNTLVINAKVASATPRFMGPTSTSGSQSGDTLTSPSGGANTWFVFSQSQPSYSTASPSGGFGSTSTTVEIKVDQGVVNPAQQ